MKYIIDSVDFMPPFFDYEGPFKEGRLYEFIRRSVLEGVEDRLHILQAYSLRNDSTPEENRIRIQEAKRFNLGVDEEFPNWDNYILLGQDDYAQNYWLLHYDQNPSYCAIARFKTADDILMVRYEFAKWADELQTELGYPTRPDDKPVLLIPQQKSL